MKMVEAKGVFERIKYEHTSNSGTKDSSAKACDVAIRSIEACGKVIDHLDSRIAETVKDIEEDPDNEEWYLGYWEGLHELKGVIGNLVKEVEE